MRFVYVIVKELDIDIPSFWDACLEYNDEDLSPCDFLSNVVLEDIRYYIDCYVPQVIDWDENEYLALNIGDALTDYVRTL